MPHRCPEATHSEGRAYDPTRGPILVQSGRQDHTENTTLPDDGVKSSFKAVRETSKMPEGTTISSVEEKTVERGCSAYTSGMSIMVVGHSDE